MFNFLLNGLSAPSDMFENDIIQGKHIVFIIIGLLIYAVVLILLYKNRNKKNTTKQSNENQSKSDE